MRGRERHQFDLMRREPTARLAVGGSAGEMNVRGNVVAGVGIGGSVDGVGSRLGLRGGGQKPKTPPAILRVMAGEPYRGPPPDDQDGFLHRRHFGPLGGHADWVTDRRANLVKRTSWANRIFGEAYQSPQLHKSLVMDARIFAGDQLSGDVSQGFRVRGTTLAGQQAAQHPGDVSIKGGLADSKGDAGNRTSRVVTNPGKSTKSVRVAGKAAIGSAHHGPGQFMEKPGPPVVSETLPITQHQSSWGLSQRGPVGEAADPTTIIRNDSGHACLLGHELRDGHAVGSGISAPGQRPVVAPVPGVEAGQGFPDFGIDRGGGSSMVGRHGRNNVYPQAGRGPSPAVA